MIFLAVVRTNVFLTENTNILVYIFAKTTEPLKLVNYFRGGIFQNANLKQKIRFRSHIHEKLAQNVTKRFERKNEKGGL